MRTIRSEFLTFETMVLDDDLLARHRIIHDSFASPLLDLVRWLSVRVAHFLHKLFLLF